MLAGAWLILIIIIVFLLNLYTITCPHVFNTAEAHCLEHEEAKSVTVV
jgi:hypothetical protein